MAEAVKPLVSSPAAAGEGARILTPTAVALWAVTFLGYGHQGLLQPIIPLYLKGLGGSELLIGFALAAFSITSFSFRPAIGFLTDEWRVAGVLSLGMLVMGVGGVGLLLPLVAVVFVTNAVRGIGWAALNTASTTMLAHIAPPRRRAEAAGYLTMFQSAATAVGSPLALWMVGSSLDKFNPVFVLAGAAGLLAAGIARFMKEPALARRTGAVPAEGRTALRVPSWRRRSILNMLDRNVALPMFLQACLTLSYPALTAFVALYAQRLGLNESSVAWYFLANGLTSVAIRLALGRLADRLPRGPSAAIGFFILGLAILLMVGATNTAWLVGSGIVYGLGYSLAIGALTALAIDMSNPLRRGAAMATYSMANQVGIGLGAALSGAIIDTAGYQAMYRAMLLPSFIAIATVALKRRQIAAAGGS